MAYRFPNQGQDLPPLPTFGFPRMIPDQAAFAQSLVWPPDHWAFTPPSFRSKVSSACAACQKRKSKCSGSPPCLECIRHDTLNQCFIDANNDLRRKAGVKRKLDELESSRSLLDGVLNIIQRGDDEHVSMLFSLIRGNATDEDIAALIRPTIEQSARTVPSKLPARDCSRPVPNLLRRPRTERVHELCNPPLQVPAHPWTSITDDDEFVSHLIFLWFTWHVMLWPYLDKDLFLRDMAAGNLDCPFCSPALVNIMLAEACLSLADYKQEESAHLAARTISDQFYNESKRLLEAEDGKLSLTNMQAQGLLWMHESSLGRDRQGVLTMSGQTGIVRTRRRDRRRKLLSDSDFGPEAVQSLQKVQQRTIWSLFIASTVFSTAFEASQTMPVPQLPCPTSKCSRDTGQWLPYPQSGQSVVFHPDCFFETACLLFTDAAVINDLVSSVESKRDFPLLKAKIDVVHKRLMTWFEGMPACLQIDGAACPHTITLHACYHWQLIALFSIPLRIARDDDGTSEKKDSIAADFQVYVARAKSLCVNAAVEIAMLMDKYRRDWTCDRMPMIFCQTSSVALFVLLDDLNGPVNTTAFVTLWTALRAMAPRWTLVKGVLRLVQLTAAKLQVCLPAEAEELFRDFEQTWSRDKQEFASQYPNYTMSIKRDSPEEDDISLGYLLAKWDTLSINPATPERQERDPPSVSSDWRTLLLQEPQSDPESSSSRTTERSDL